MCSQEFDAFWKHYPKKVGKLMARKAWEKINPDGPLLEQMLVALTSQIQSDQWTRDGGKYIPHPATWLNGKRWEDDLQPAHDPMKAMVQSFVERGA